MSVPAYQLVKIRPLITLLSLQTCVFTRNCLHTYSCTHTRTHIHTYTHTYWPNMNVSPDVPAYTLMSGSIKLKIYSYIKVRVHRQIFDIPILSFTKLILVWHKTNGTLLFFFFFYLRLFDGVHFQYSQILEHFLFSKGSNSFLFWQFYTFCYSSFYTFHYEHGTFFYDKFHFYILAFESPMRFHFCKGLMSSVRIKWLMFSCDFVNL